MPIFTAGILGGLVGITAICTLCRPWEALLIGMIGSVLTCTGMFDHVYIKNVFMIMGECAVNDINNIYKMLS